MTDSSNNSRKSQKGKRKNRPSQDELISAAAALWISRRESVTAEERKEFCEWMKQSPSHARKMLFEDYLFREYDPQRQINVDDLLRACRKIHIVRVTEIVESRHQQQQPLHLLESVAKFVSQAAYEAFLESAIAEARVEIYQAERGGRKSTATMIKIRCYWTILKPLRAALWATLMLWLRWKGS